LECRLDVAGEGHLESRLKGLARGLAIDDRVRFLGQVPHERLLAMLQERRVTLVVLPSVDLGDGLHEGIPVALIEAMSQGIPVISTPTGGIPELLRDGAGIMVPAKDPLALADAIERVINDAELQKRLSLAGRKRVEEEFSVEAVIDKFIEYIGNGAP
jgi:glycosyltransferase involved in cell wall biosynthesis